MKKDSFVKFLGRFSVGSHHVMPGIIASVVGIMTGFIAVGFIKLIGLGQELFFNKGGQILSGMGPYYVILIPAVGGLLVGPLIVFLAPEAKGHGVPEVLKAIAIKRGRIRPIVVVVKFVASIVSIASGASVGREGPIVQVGAALGSSMAQFLKLGEIRIRNMIACGAAAGISAVFNAPIAGVMFASEVILKDFGASALSTVVIAAVSSGVVSRIFLGESPAFTSPSYSMKSPYEIFIYVALGVFSAFAALLFMTVLHKSEDFFERLKSPDWLKPMIGGVLVGGIGLFFPHVFGTGLTTIEEALHGHLVFSTLLILIFLKIIATSISLGAGSSGGVFAPALMIGAVLGGTVGNLAAYQQFSFPVEASGAYALVGMASVFAAAAHAPVTAILIVFEMTGDYQLILPIMVSVVIATSISQRIHRESIYTAKLKQKGIDIGFLEEVKVLGAMQVQDAMTSNFEIVSNDTPAKQLIERMTASADKVLFTINEDGKGKGVIEIENIQKAFLEENMNLIVAEDIAVPIAEWAALAEPLSEAARVMAAHHLKYLPVVDSRHAFQIVGILRFEDILRTYSIQSTKRSEIVEQMEQEELVPKKMLSVPFVVSPQSFLVGQMIRDLKLPDGVRFSSIKRGKEYLVPNGTVIFNAKDKVWTTLTADKKEAFSQWLNSQNG